MPSMVASFIFSGTTGFGTFCAFFSAVAGTYSPFFSYLSSFTVPLYDFLADSVAEADAEADAFAGSEALALAEASPEAELSASGRISLAQAVSAARTPVAPTPRRVRRVKKVVIGSPSLEPIQSKSCHTPRQTYAPRTGLSVRQCIYF